AAENGKTANPANLPTIDWQKLIDGDSLAAEVKRARLELAAASQSSAKFEAHRADVRMLAATIAVLAQIADAAPYSVSWKSRSPAIRDAAVELGAAADKSGKEVFANSKEHFDRLIDLLEGNAGTNSAGSPRDFSEISERSDLMKRMDRSVQWAK